MKNEISESRRHRQVTAHKLYQQKSDDFLWYIHERNSKCMNTCYKDKAIFNITIMWKEQSVRCKQLEACVSWYMTR